MRPSERFGAVVLWLCAIGFAYFGARFLISPTEMAQTLGIQLTSGDATADVRAVYGGLERGVGGLFAWCAATRQRRTEGLVSGAVLLLSMGLARLLGIFLAQPQVSGMLWSFLALEVIGGLLCALAAWLGRSIQMNR